MGLVPLPDPEQIAWLLRCVPEMGRYRLFEFRVDGALRGWSLSHLPPPGVEAEACIVDLWADPASAAPLSWMLAETLARIAEDRPDAIVTAAGSPALLAALRQARFLVRQRVPVLVWPRDLEVPRPPHHVLYNTGDFPLVPYPAGAAGP
jgi:hypothetical protein